jgi:anthranilate phosphoribosyltransferase
MHIRSSAHQSSALLQNDRLDFLVIKAYHPLYKAVKDLSPSDNI